jgi:tetratricopeptide (TPR) repeat protein
MKWLRATAAVLIVAACALAATRLVIPRLRCNRDKAIVNSATMRLERGAADYERTVQARQLAEMCRRCLERFPNDYEFHLLLASNEAFVGDLEGAEQSYRRSLALNERPEALAYLAVMQLGQGKTEEARKNLYRAALFNLAVVELVSDPLKSEVAQAVVARHKTLGSENPLERWKNRRRPEADGSVPRE